MDEDVEKMIESHEELVAKTLSESQLTLENVVMSHLQNVGKVSLHGKKQYSGHVDTEDEFHDFLTDLKAVGFSFAVRNSVIRKTTPRICFTTTHGERDVNVPFTGTPFQVLKSIYMDCSQGKNYKKPDDVRDERTKVDPENPPVEHHYSKKLPPKTTKKSKKARLLDAQNTGDTKWVPVRKPRDSKKVDCTAYMSVKCIRIFQGYKLKSCARWSREKTKLMKKLNQDLAQVPQPPSIVRYMIVLSPAEEHNHTIVSTNLSQTIHPKLIEEIHNIVKRNIYSVHEVKIWLTEFVQNMFEESKLPQPEKTDRCYYPTNRVIYYHMRNAFAKLRVKAMDIMALEECIKEWKIASPQDSFFFRHQNDRNKISLSCAESSSETILFCHQTEWQECIMNKYGNDISLLDAAFKTPNCRFPAYFIHVKTDNGYCIVGTFIIQSESADLISEALSVFATSNPNWEPKYFMTGLSFAEFSAIEEIFPNATVYISPFHRNQMWTKWFKKELSLSSEAESCLKTLWQAIAASSTRAEYEINLKTLFSSNDYRTSEVAQSYFTGTWLPYVHRWVEAFMTSDFLSKVYGNNGIEMLNVLQQFHLARFPVKTLTGILKLHIEHYLHEVFSANAKDIDMLIPKVEGIIEDPLTEENSEPCEAGEHVKHFISEEEIMLLPIEESTIGNHTDVVILETSECVEPIKHYLSKDLNNETGTPTLSHCQVEVPTELEMRVDQDPLEFTVTVEEDPSASSVQTEMQDMLKRLTDRTCSAKHSGNLQECLNLLKKIEKKMLES